MKKVVNIILMIIIPLIIVTGCGCERKKEEIKKEEEKTVIKNQIYEGLEFVNAGIENNEITTIVINNTGVLYEGSKFKIKIMDENGNVIIEEIDEVKEEMKTGTTKEIKTKTKADLSKAASIEYSVVKEK